MSNSTTNWSQNTMTNRNSSKKVLILTVTIIVLLAGGGGTLVMLNQRKQNTSAARYKKIASLSAERAAIPNLDTKENIAKFKKVNAQITAIEDAEWKDLEAAAN